MDSSNTLMRDRHEDREQRASELERYLLGLIRGRRDDTTPVELEAPAGSSWVSQNIGTGSRLNLSSSGANHTQAPSAYYHQFIDTSRSGTHTLRQSSLAPPALLPIHELGARASDSVPPPETSASIIDAPAHMAELIARLRQSAIDRGIPPTQSLNTSIHQLESTNRGEAGTSHIITGTADTASQSHVRKGAADRRVKFVGYEESCPSSSDAESSDSVILEPGSGAEADEESDGSMRETPIARRIVCGKPEPSCNSDAAESSEEEDFENMSGDEADDELRDDEL